MNNLDFSSLPTSVEKKLAPLVAEVLAAHGGNIHSMHVTGSAVLPDYDAALSDINSLLVLNAMDVHLLDFLAPLGKRYGKTGVAAPLVMTESYIERSLDAFPLEFLDFKLIHKTIYGNDILQGLAIDRRHLRLQCERDIKAKLIGLRQGYLSSLGRKDRLASLLVRSITGSMGLFRAVLAVLGKDTPLQRPDVVRAFGNAVNVDPTVFLDLLALKAVRIKPSERELHGLFTGYHAALDTVGNMIDDLPL